MEGNARTWFTPKQKAELWERWKSGQCVADIARALERRNKSGVYRVLALNGGIAPAPRRRASVALRLEEREEISRGIAAGRSIRRIAEGLGRSPSTVSREIKRNGGCSAYRASEADRRAWERALRPKPCRLGGTVLDRVGRDLERKAYSAGQTDRVGLLGRLYLSFRLQSYAIDPNLRNFSFLAWGTVPAPAYSILASLSVRVISGSLSGFRPIIYAPPCSWRHSFAGAS